MYRSYALNLCDAETGQFYCANDAHASLVLRDDAVVVRKIRFPPGVAPRPFGNLDPFALALPPRFVVVPRRLQRSAE